MHSSDNLVSPSLCPVLVLLLGLVGGERGRGVDGGLVGSNELGTWQRESLR